MIRYLKTSLLIICLHYLVRPSLFNEMNDDIRILQVNGTKNSKENAKAENISTTLGPIKGLGLGFNKTTESESDEELDLGGTEENVIEQEDQPEYEGTDENDLEHKEAEYEGTEENEPGTNLGSDEIYDAAETSKKPNHVAEDYGLDVDIKYDKESSGAGTHSKEDSRRTIPNDTEFIPWDELHIVKIRTVTTRGFRKSGGALVQDRIVVSSCRCMKVSDEKNPISFPEKQYKNKNDMVVRRSVTGETRFVDKITFGIRRYCIDDPDTSVLVVLILTKPFHTEPLLMVPRAAGYKLCRLYTFKRYPDTSPEPSILGHYDLAVFLFHSNGRLCKNATYDLTNPAIVCGVIVDDDHQLCNMRIGGVVICSVRLLGVTQTSCKVPYYQHANNKTRVIAYVSMLTKPELRYWQKLISLIGGETDSSGKNGCYFSLLVLLIVALELLNISYKT